MELAANKQFRHVRQALNAAIKELQISSQSPRLDAEMLLAAARGVGREWLYANPDSELSDKQAQVFAALLTQRAEGRPIAHLTGVREFWSLDLAVNEFTLVPRPETELLVEQALERLPEDRPCRVLDLGTGSGAIAIAISCERPAAVVVAIDCCADALSIARENAARHCPGRIDFLQGDWFRALPADSAPFDVIVSNPPYVGENEADLTDPELAFEPVNALYSGKDGLDAIRSIVAETHEHLRPGGWLLLEHGFAQANAVHRLLDAAGFVSMGNATDLAGQPRVSYGRHRQH